jgi:hypothetical protein
MRRPCLASSLALFALFSAAPAAAQGVLVAPHALIVDHRVRSGSLTLYNPGTEAVEVEVGSIFGYPDAGPDGRLFLRTSDAPDAVEPSAAGWIEAFPRRMTLAPLQRQTVRVLARPPAGLPDGEYWSRIVVSARGGQVPVTGADTSRIQVGLALEVRTIISFNYRKGPVATGVRIDSLGTTRAGDSLAVRARLTRAGTAAWLGTWRLSLQDEAGRPVRTFETSLAVYHSMAPVFPLDVAGLAPGRYRLAAEAVTEREDIPAGELLLAPPATAERVVDLR